jgi:hypothetical protein
MKPKSILPCLTAPLLMLALSSATQAQNPSVPPAHMERGGAACVMAKWMGDTLDYAISINTHSGGQAQLQAEQMLRERGYGNYKANVDVMHPQAVTSLPHAFVAVVKTSYTSARGKPRTSYGCGFSPSSPSHALQLALQNLQSYAWGWNPDRDKYEIVQQGRY